MARGLSCERWKKYDVAVGAAEEQSKGGLDPIY